MSKTLTGLDRVHELRRKRRSQEAVDYLREELDRTPDAADLRFELGALLDEAGMVGPARAEYERAIKSDPEWADPHHNLGWSYGMLSPLDRRLSERHMRQALRLDPENPQRWYAFGVILNFAGKLEEAKEAFHKSLALQPSDTIREAAERQLKAIKARLKAANPTA